MWKQAVPWLALLASLLVIFFQRKSISLLQSQSNIQTRSKRSIEDNSLYVPVFAQISRKAMKRLCRQQSRRNVKPNLVTTTEPPVIYRKKCSGDVTFGPARLIAKRPHTVGSVMKDGDQWYVTEYHLGYNVLQFVSSKNLNNSLPHEVYTLPYAFQGTDMTVLNGTIFFNSADDLVAYNFPTGSVNQDKLPLSKLPLYNSSSSVVDIQIEEHGLWAIFRQTGEKSLTVRRMVPSTLKDIDSSSWCNSFVRCGILYSVRCARDELKVQPVYDFYQNLQIGGRVDSFSEIREVSSVQYDPKSRQLVLFSAGKILSIQTL